MTMTWEWTSFGASCRGRLDARDASPCRGAGPQPGGPGLVPPRGERADGRPHDRAPRDRTPEAVGPPGQLRIDHPDARPLRDAGRGAEDDVAPPGQADGVGLD